MVVAKLQTKKFCIRMYIKAAELIHSNESNFVSVFFREKNENITFTLKKVSVLSPKRQLKDRKKLQYFRKRGFFSDKCALHFSSLTS